MKQLRDAQFVSAVLGVLPIFGSCGDAPLQQRWYDRPSSPRMVSAADTVLELTDLGSRELLDQIESGPFSTIALGRWQDQLEQMNVSPRRSPGFP